MPELATLSQSIERRSAELAGKLTAQRPRRLWIEVPKESLRPLLELACRDLGFTFLCTITGFDEPPVLGAIYHLAHEDGTLLNITVKVPRDAPVLQSVCDLYPGCTSYERELDDLLGFVIEGMPKGKRYPLPDDWPQGDHPLRKDWKKAGEPQASATATSTAATAAKEGA